MAGRRRKLQQTTKRSKIQQPTMNDDLILEIVRRLPLKYAVQCSLLNKSIRRRIVSQPDFLPHCWTVFYSGYDSPKLFKIIQQKIRSVRVHPPCKSLTLDTIVYIRASCNGLLFLRVNKRSSDYYVFNPATAGIVAINHHIEFSASIGLAVSNSGCKLVGVEEGYRLRITVFVPGSRGWMTTKSEVWFDPGRKIEIMRDDDSRPVYADGGLYWLANDGRITMAFDLEKEEARLIKGPVQGDEIVINSKWFGFTDGSIYFVYSTASEIVISRLDGGCGGGWRVEKRISKPENSNEAPLSLHGPQLITFRVNGAGADILRYDLASDLKEKVNLTPLKGTKKPKFFSYTSTFVKVSNYYLNEKDGGEFWKKEGLRNAFLGLQKHLVPTAVDSTPVYVKQALMEGGIQTQVQPIELGRRDPSG